MKLPLIDKAIQIFLRMSKREKMVLYVTAFVLVVMFSDHLVIQPIIGKFRSLEQQYGDLQTDVKKSVKLLTQKDRMLEEVKHYDTYLSEPRSEEQATSALLREVEQVANEAAVNLLYAKPGGSKSDGAAKKSFVTLECEGKMDQIVKFFYSLENSKQLLRVEKYILQPAAKNSVVIKCAATVSKIIIPR